MYDVLVLDDFSLLQTYHIFSARSKKIKKCKKISLKKPWNRPNQNKCAILHEMKITWFTLYG